MLSTLIACIVCTSKYLAVTVLSRYLEYFAFSFRLCNCPAYLCNLCISRKKKKRSECQEVFDFEHSIRLQLGYGYQLLTVTRLTILRPGSWSGYVIVTNSNRSASPVKCTLTGNSKEWYLSI